MGKGGPWLLPHLLQTHKLEPRRTAMVVSLGCAGARTRRPLRPLQRCSAATTRADGLLAAPLQGDRVDTDIAFGLEGGLTTILTHGTGVTTLERALATPPHAAPHFLVPSITVLAGLQ